MPRLLPPGRQGRSWSLSACGEELCPWGKHILLSPCPPAVGHTPALPTPSFCLCLTWGPPEVLGDMQPVCLKSFPVCVREERGLRGGGCGLNQVWGGGCWEELGALPLGV